MNAENFHCLGDISTEDFLANYWQKKPLLIRNAFPSLQSGNQSPITADELAGLACEEDINARLVLEKDGDYPWQAENGPFDESRFSTLPETHWSLLVSDMERYLPETKSLVKPFRFLPDWRRDDLMISYAPEGGSVGPHVDDYDVFLIQLSGQRLWKISEHFSDEAIEGVDLRILKTFDAEQEWLCNPGDMLYLPPNVAHHGVAQHSLDKQGNNLDCMTASVGFRAPSLKTITSDYVNFLNESTHSNKRFTDAIPKKPKHHAEISDETVSQFIDYLKQGITLEDAQVKCWLGQYCSDNKAFEEFCTEKNKTNFDEITIIATESSIIHSPYSNFLFSRFKQGALLFVNGISYEVSLPFAESICQDETLNFVHLQQSMNQEDKEIFLALFNRGALIAEDNL